MTQTVSIVVPCYNEQESVVPFWRELSSVLSTQPDSFRVLFVDDGSTDGTLAELTAIAQADPRVSVCSLARNFGHQVALSAGLDRARGQAVILMDSDLQHPPALIPTRLAPLQSSCERIPLRLAPTPLFTGTIHRWFNAWTTSRIVTGPCMEVVSDGISTFR
jgi:glycosyltransferase involved in cell wall biosynthesis